MSYQINDRDYEIQGFVPFMTLSREKADAFIKNWKHDFQEISNSRLILIVVKKEDREDAYKLLDRLYPPVYPAR